MEVWTDMKTMKKLQHLCRVFDHLHTLTSDCMVDVGFIIQTKSSEIISMFCFLQKKTNQKAKKAS